MMGDERYVIKAYETCYSFTRRPRLHRATFSILALSSALFIAYIDVFKVRKLYTTLLVRRSYKNRIR